MTELFTAAQLATLRTEFASLPLRIDPLMPAYQRMIARLNGLPVEQLRQIRDAKIRILSSLALNRCGAAVRK